MLSKADQDRIVKRELRHFLRNVPGESAPIEDLEAAARLGLEEAAAAYDPRIGVPFGAFARYRVHGAIRDTASEIYPHTRRNLQWLREQLLVHEAMRPRVITAERPREDLARGTMAQLKQLALVVAAEVIATAADAISPEDALVHAEDLNVLKKSVALLQRPDRELIRAAYGFDDGTNASQYGARKGLSRSQVSRRRAKILQTLRQHLTAGLAKSDDSS